MKRKLFLWKTQILVCCFLLFTNVGIYAQTNSLRGQVLDASTQDPLIGVSIMEKGTSNGTITDIDGNFTLNVPQGATIVISYIGYVAVEQKADKSVMKILMKEDAKALEEVVVIGYGVQKKVNLTGAVSSVDGATLAAKPATDAVAALQGVMPGVAVLRSGGEPGKETTGIRVRGFSSVNETSTLILIDGVEGDMTLVNPNDIASVSVLKDAAAAAIYGARAAAGVVLITTKSGSEGKPKITYNGYFGVNTPGNMPQRLPAWEEQEFIDESRRQANGTPEWSPEQASWVGNPNFNYRPNISNGRWDFFQATNWVNEGIRDYTTQQSHSVSASGGKKELNYLVSAGYYTKNGILKYGPDKNERYNLRIKVNTELSKHFDLGLMASYQGKNIEENPYGAKNILGRLYRVRGRQPIMNPEEDINENPYNGDLQVNAIDLMQNGGINKNQYEAYVGKGELTIKDYVKGLKLKLSASRQAGYYSSTVEKRTLVWFDRLGKTERFSANKPNEMTRTKNGDYHDNFEALLTYDLSINKHSISALAGSTYERYRKDEMAGTIKSLNSNDFFSFNYYDNSVVTNTDVSDKIETWGLMSYFGRINYNFSDIYLFEANVRYDGSSRVAPENRWQAFPSFSAAWRVNEESWFNVPAISNLKARASWGQLGNGAVLGLYDYIPLISSGNNQGEGYYYQPALASKSKKWETISSTNIGIDLGLLNNKLNITADYYWKTNDDMLASLQLPDVIGINVPNSNVGKLKVWGWEFEANYKDRIGKVNYQIGFNISDSQNELVEYDGQNSIWAGSVSTLQGYPLNTIWGYKTDGFWSSRDEYLAYKAANPGYESFNDAKVSGGDTKYVSQGKADHIIGAGGGTPEKPGDLIYLGDSNGRYLYGINLGLQWNNFDFSMMFQGVGKRTVLIEGSTMAPLAATADMPWTIHRDYWTPENTDAYWPRLYSGNSFNFNPSDRWVQDASYIRLKNVTLGYNVPLKKGFIEKLRVYLSGQDVWEHSNMIEVFDPEVGNQPNSNNTYPFFRTWTFGLNFTL